MPSAAPPENAGLQADKEPAPKPSLCRKGVCRDRERVCVGGGGCQKGVLFLPASAKQTSTRNSRAKASRGHGRGGRCVGCSPFRLFSEPVSSETVVSSSLRKQPRHLADSPLFLPFLGMREVAGFQIRGPSQAAGLHSFSGVDLLFFLRKKPGFSFPIWNKGKLLKIIFKFWLNLFS